MECDRAERAGLVSGVAVLLRVLPIVVALLMVKNAFDLTTYRLFLEDHAAAGRPTSARQRFSVEGGRIVPQVLTDGPARFVFDVEPDRACVLQLDLYAAPEMNSGAAIERGALAGARYAIDVVRAGARHRITSELRGATSIREDLPPGPIRLEFSGDGSLIWSDIRLVRRYRFVPHLAALLLSLAALWRLRDWPQFALRPTMRLRLVNSALMLGAAVSTLAAFEVVARLKPAVLPGSVLALRRDLGEFHSDLRWQDSTRYVARLRPHLRTFCEYRSGDIVTMGVMPVDVHPRTLLRFVLQTDAEGFRNPATRDWIDVAALGDSFTDALTLPVELSWPARLEQALGRSVQNYGTAGFGPQQERYVLEDYALAHRPRTVILAYFTGNDLRNAESFDRFERSHGTVRPETPGWRIKPVVALFDELYATSIVRAAASRLRSAEPSVRAFSAAEFRGEDPSTPPVDRAQFDRGLFAVPVSGRTLRVALLPAYLRELAVPELRIRSSGGWSIVQETLAAMQTECASHGAAFIVMLIPSKSQVYWPLLRSNFSDADLEAALRFYFPERSMRPDLVAIDANRLAQNALLRQFCDSRRIPLLDLTPPLKDAVESGVNVYFPDDTHWNAAGHQLAATALAQFLDGPSR